MSNINYEQIKNVSINNYQSSPFELFQDVKTKSNFDGNIKHIQTESGLSTAYFSKKNIDFLQNEIIRIIYQKSNNKYKIGRQSDIQLEIIMRSIYLSYSKNLECNIDAQIKVLNDKVLQFSCDSIMSEIIQYIGYVDDISKPIKPLEHPKNVSSSGEKTLTPDVGFTSFSS
jgi:hypothetical protein